MFIRYLTGIFIVGASFLFMPGCSEDKDDETGPKPEANFIASATEIEAGDSITFEDTSSNDPYLWTWEFNGGEPSYSNKQNPTVVYPGAGVYSIRMKARNDYGGDEIFKEDYIEVTSPPPVDIDIEAQIRLEFEENLESTGLIEITAETEGAAEYTNRPGGGKAYEFTGNNPLILPGYKGINEDNERTVALWVKTTMEGRGVMLHWGESGMLSRSTFSIQPDGFIRYEVQGGGWNAQTDIKNSEWHHVAYTYDGDNIHQYVDGELEQSVSGIELDTGVEGYTDVDIGTMMGNQVFEGAMDDVRIFDVALSAEDIKILSEMN